VGAGTSGGLCRFDAYGMVVYKHDIGDPRSLSDNSVHVIYEDRAGVLWVGTRGGGLNRFDRATEQFTRFQHDPNNPNSPSRDEILAICEGNDRDSTLWLGTWNGGLNAFSRSKMRFTHYRHDAADPASLSDENVTALYSDRGGMLWIGTWESGLNRFDPANGRFSHYRFNRGASPDESANVINNRAFHADGQGMLWFGTRSGLTRFNLATGEFKQYQHDPRDPNSLSNNDVMAVCEDRFGTLWIGTNRGGLNRFDRVTEKFTAYRHDPNDPHSLGSNSVRSLCADDAGLIWVGTTGTLNKFDPAPPPFQHHQTNGAVNVLYKSPARDEELWIGTQTGLYYRPGDAREPSSIRNEHGKIGQVKSLYEDRQIGALWIGTWGGGLMRLDRDSKRLTHYRLDDNNPNHSDRWIESVIQSRSGEIWLAADGVYRIRLDQNGKPAFKVLGHNPADPHSLSSNEATVVYEDRAGTLWVGTRNAGLNKLVFVADDSAAFIHYRPDPKNPNSLSHNRILTIYESRAGEFWIGAGIGLNKFDRAQETFKHYTASDGLPNDQINGIVEDDRGRLWLCTNDGIAKFDPRRETFKVYDESDGLTSRRFWAGAKSAFTGEVFLGGDDGYYVFHPDSLKDNSFVPPVVFTRFERYNTDDAEGVAISEKGLSARQSIAVMFKDNILTLGFAALNYRNPHKNQYAYKLEGYSDKWIHLGNKREVTFTNLDAGEYTLRVKGSNDDGVWNETARPFALPSRRRGGKRGGRMRFMG